MARKQASYAFHVMARLGSTYKDEGYQMVEGIPVVVKPEEVKYPTILNTLKALITFIIGG